MNKALCISAAIAMALSGAAYAGGAKHSKSSASDSMSTAFSQKDCQMLSVESARTACMRSAARSNGGVDAAVVGSTASATISGNAAGAASSDVEARSNAGIDPSAVGGTSSSATGEIAMPKTYDAPHR